MYGYTSLQYAVGVCNWPLAKLILGAGGSLDATNQDGFTPTDIASREAFEIRESQILNGVG
jgi:ankyrin repeat protein